MTLNEIREDLKNIKYYYSRKKVFEEAFQATGRSDVLDKVAEYNEIIRSAPARMYDLYVSLYIKNHTQESLSNELGYTPEYIQMLNKKLLKFIQKEFSLKGV
ncbi:MAG: hypothetical protein IJ817_01850 [Clostridia bacterium]|nr:hypothetical protein [Clostridia bacterium]